MQTKTLGEALTLSSTVPTRTGYTFLGWATSADADAAEYQPGDSYTDDADVTLYAVWQENEVTPTTNARFVVSDAEAKPGGEVTVTVSTENNPGIAAFMLYLVYDSDILTWTDVTTGDINSGMWDVAVDEGLLWFDADNFSGDAVILTLTFLVNETAEEGTTTISLTYDPEDVCDENLENVYFAVVDGTVTIKTHTPGDINGDGKVNNKDLVRLIQYIKGKDVEVVEDALDITGDGKVNNKDLVRLIQYNKGNDVVIY